MWELTASGIHQSSTNGCLILYKQIEFSSTQTMVTNNNMINSALGLQLLHLEQNWVIWGSVENLFSFKIRYLCRTTLCVLYFHNLRSCPNDFQSYPRRYSFSKSFTTSQFKIVFLIPNLRIVFVCLFRIILKGFRL